MLKTSFVLPLKYQSYMVRYSIPILLSSAVSLMVMPSHKGIPHDAHIILYAIKLVKMECYAYI